MRNRASAASVAKAAASPVHPALVMAAAHHAVVADSAAAVAVAFMVAAADPTAAVVDRMVAVVAVGNRWQDGSGLRK